MPDVSNFARVTRDPTAYDYTLIGTVAGTTTIQSQPTFFRGLVITKWTSGQTHIIYDSIGTSGTVIGTVILGTSPTNNPPGLIEFGVATKNGLTVTNAGDQGAVVLFK